MSVPKKQKDIEEKIKKVLKAKRLFIVGAELSGEHDHDGDDPEMASSNTHIYANNICMAEAVDIMHQALTEMFENDETGKKARMALMAMLMTDILKDFEDGF